MFLYMVDGLALDQDNLGSICMSEVRALAGIPAISGIQELAGLVLRHSLLSHMGFCLTMSPYHAVSPLRSDVVEALKGSGPSKTKCLKPSEQGCVPLATASHRPLYLGRGGSMQSRDHQQGSLELDFPAQPSPPQLVHRATTSFHCR